MNTKEAIERVRTRFDKWALDNEDLTALQVLGLVDAESEDERMLREIKRYIKEQGDKPTGLPNGTVAVSDMIAWLEKHCLGWLEKKKEQKQEWCKEDEDIMWSLVADLKAALNCCTHNMDDYYKERINWLKLLKERIK